MAPQLKTKTPGVKGVERVVDREVGKAVDALDNGKPLSDEAVHGARKRLKRARAALRLMRVALGNRVYRRENRALRDAARPLSEARDSKVLVDTLDSLDLDGAVAARALRAVLVEKRQATQRKLQNPKRIASVLGEMRSARRRVDRAKAQGHGWSAIGPGLRRTYRAARRAFAAARLDPTPERLHEWRKQTKYWWHILEMLEPIDPVPLRARARRVHRLSDQLGEDHDLVVLRDTASRSSDPATRGIALEKIDRRRLNLQKRAMALGAVIYRERPKTLERRLQRRWRAWRSDPSKG